MEHLGLPELWFLTGLCSSWLSVGSPGIEYFPDRTWTGAILFSTEQFFPDVFSSEDVVIYCTDGSQDTEINSISESSAFPKLPPQLINFNLSDESNFCLRKKEKRKKKKRQNEFVTFIYNIEFKSTADLI